MSPGGATPSSAERIDRGSRFIRATPAALYAAHLNADAVAGWRPPAGMTAQIYSFDGRAGGGYRMAFVYDDPTVGGKTSENADVFTGTFAELIENERIVERITFDSLDPAFSGIMTIRTTFQAVDDGTLVTIECSDVPPGISPEDHGSGIASTLDNLATFAERT